SCESEFFSQSYARHRDLHSFPTRRSSDLSRSRSWEDYARRLPGSEVFLTHRGRGLGESVRGLAVALAGVAIRAHDADVVNALVEDRKSTRLNSSHVKISYAVFCLKKKKTR